MAEKTHHLAEFQPLLSRLEADGIEYALIGGLAVAHYGEHYLSRELKIRHQFPIYSKDIDFRGGQELYEAIQRTAASVGMELAGGMGRIKPRPGANRAHGYVLAVVLDGLSTSIEIMERLPLHNLELTELEVTGSAIRLSDVTILDPFTLLLTKLAALHERPQGEINHDAAHCAILSDVIPRFLEDALSKHQSRQTDYDPATDAWRLLRVLKRGNHPLPGDEAANSRFVEHLEAVTLNWLSQTDREMPSYRASSSSPR